MREIKFRAWWPSIFTMQYFDNIAFIEAPDLLTLKDYDFNPDTGGFSVIDEQILMQYTGLKDKNDKEIYEGDIVIDLNGRKGFVESQYGCFGWSIIPAGFSTFFKVAGSKFEVIGNIYENKELLK